jgi:hypothetical protein
MTDHRLLAIYLNDHLSGAVSGRELANRAAGANEDHPSGPELRDLAREIQEDEQTLRSVMEAVGARTDPLKQVAGWAAEKAGRLKLNGRLVGYSPLSRVVELEGLSLGIEGKRSLWVSLGALAQTEERLAGFDFPALEKRASEQRMTVERLRVLAVLEAIQH